MIKNRQNVFEQVAGLGVDSALICSLGDPPSLLRGAAPGVGGGVQGHPHQDPPLLAPPRPLPPHLGPPEGGAPGRHLLLAPVDPQGWWRHVLDRLHLPQEMLAHHVEAGGEQCEQLPGEILVQHSVAFFLGLCTVSFNAVQ